MFFSVRRQGPINLASNPENLFSFWSFFAMIASKVRSRVVSSSDLPTACSVR
jgi:hypothetical protein